MLAALTLSVFAQAAAAPSAQQAPPPTFHETAEQRDRRMAWFREARFGIFLHWGLYSVAGGQWDGQRVGDCGEWIQKFGNIPTSRYKELLPRFAPKNYDPAAWAKLFRDAGARYIVVTTKHHDGFCLWDSAVNDDWDAAASGAKRDLLAPLAQACRSNGIKFGAYYSILDWRHPDYGVRQEFNDHAQGPADMQRYFERYMLPQLDELLRGCKPDYLWFDGGWDACYTHEMGVRVDDHVRAVSPAIVVNNRVDKGFTGMDGRTAEGGFRGDCGTPEQEIPENGFGPGVDWETCYSMMKIPGKWTWGWRSDVTEWSTARQIVDLLADCSSRGGNLLLNVGPTPDGEIPPQAVEPLLGAGAWLGRCGEAIYGTQASPFKKRPAFGHVTRKGSTLYLLVADAQPGQMLVLPGLETPIAEVELVGGEAKGGDCAFGARTDDTIVLLPADLVPDPLRTVVRVKLEGEPVVSEPRLRPVDGRLELLPDDARISGSTMRIERRDGHVNLGYWLDPADSAAWDVELDAGEWELRASMGCKNAAAGSVVEIAAGTTVVAQHVVQGTGDDWRSYAETKLGSWKVPQASKTTLRLLCKEKKGEAVANIERLVLVKR